MDTCPEIPGAVQTTTFCYVNCIVHYCLLLLDSLIANGMSNCTSCLLLYGVIVLYGVIA